MIGTKAKRHSEVHTTSEDATDLAWQVLFLDFVRRFQLPGWLNVTSHSSYRQS
jgi:hypothetical protein